jgi:hypothetical protein
MRGPTIARVFPKAGGERDWFAVTVIVRRDLLLTAVEQLRKAGAADMTVLDLHYVFEHRSWNFEALQRQLARTAGRQPSAASRQPAAVGTPDRPAPDVPAPVP